MAPASGRSETDCLADDASPRDVALTTIRLSSFGLGREPPRRPEDRQPGYEALFDYDTLFYDVFHGPLPGQITCLGPPLLGCEAALSSVVFRSPDGEPIAWRYLPPRSSFQPSCRFLLHCPGPLAADRLRLEVAGRDVEFPIQPGGQRAFRGRRVAWTLSKDNPLLWTRDWAGFNAAIHGADAILLYDNGSSRYGLADIQETLAAVKGITEAIAVPWNFPYGPGTGPRNVQDSFYCQPGALEHARRRFCSEARAVLNTDIDELVVLESGGSLFDRLERCGRCAIVFNGFWVEGRAPRAQAGETVRHRDCLDAERWRFQFRHLLPRRWLLRSKWAVLPERCPESVDWGVHDLYAADPGDPRTAGPWKLRPRDLFYRHFRQINTGWKRSPWRVRRYSPLRVRRDRRLARAIAALGDAPIRGR